MDNIFFIYQIKVSVALAMFYILYMFCLRNDTFLKIRRFFFLFAIFFSVGFPFIKLELPSNPEAAMQIPGYWLSEFEFGAIATDHAAEKPIGIWDIILIFFIIVSILFALRFIIQLFSILKLRTNNETEDLQSCRIIKIKDEKTSPFSFFKWIFVNSGKYNQHELGEIITHEQIHARQFHSIDVILSEILCICFWWNPFAWLIRKEIKINLEYLADEGVLNAGFDSKEYQYILLQVSNKSTGIPLINNFNVSQLKKRITMMNKRKTSIARAVKYLLAIPIGSVLLLGNAAQASSADLINIITEETPFDGNQVPQKKGDIFTTVEEMPQYPGGENEMHKFIASNLKYPVEAQKNKIEGRVTLRFVIKSTGEIEDVVAIRKVNPLLEEEAIRVVKAMPNWNPGKQGGKAVDVYFTLPVVFRLKGSNKNVLPAKNENTVVVVGYGDTPSSRGNTNIAIISKAKAGDDKPFLAVEQMPSFPGGEKAMQEFVANNLKYPVAAQNAGIQGRVIIRFIVGNDGSINDVNVIRGLSDETDAEAVRVIKSMPKWTPGKQKGKAVPVYFIIPIVYRLKKDEPKENTPQT